jgi:peptide/nickel transport system ATP-binding protein
MHAEAPLLEVDALSVEFETLAGTVRAVDRVSWRLAAGGTLGLVGESGCGKSVTALSILRLLAEPPARIGGAVRFRGDDLLQRSEREMRRIRGDRISMIFQDAWWFMVFPGLALLITVLAFNIVGDGLQDALNPRTSK